ncbi:MAG: CBS domain-containing protein [Anaerolineales bacterium]|nr:CBS domain-containing protein [Anaerolineales bacterium]
MAESFLTPLALVLCLILDLVMISVRSSFLQTSYAHLLPMREREEQQVIRTIGLLPALPRLRASLNFALVLTRFLLAGLILQLVQLRALGWQIWVQVLVFFLAVLLIFWLEWICERIVSRHPALWAMRLTPLARAWMFLAALPIAPLNLPAVGEGILQTGSGVMESDVKTLVDAGQEEGVFEQEERRMIYSIFELGDTLAREIMVPRIDMLALDVTTPLLVAVDVIINSGHSRVPVYEEVVDKTLGVLYIKDLMRLWREGNPANSLHDLLRPAYFVPEAKKVDELLAEMQAERIHMAIVVDEYGGVAGLVTLEDIVEEILGEIQDEFDQSEEAPYQQLKDGSYIFLGRVDLDDFNEVMGSFLPKEEADTLGGYIYSRLGRVPAGGETVENDNLLLTVEQVSARRIRKVRARWLPLQIDTVDKDEDSANR